MHRIVKKKEARNSAVRFQGLRKEYRISKGVGYAGSGKHPDHSIFTPLREHEATSAFDIIDDDFDAKSNEFRRADRECALETLWPRWQHGPYFVV